jgi:rhodanese-related sulfurtransferase
LAARIEAGDAPLVLDVRSTGEYEAGHVPGAVNIPHDELAARIDEISASKSDEIIVYCHSGRRADAAESTLEAAGYTGVVDLEGHWKGWSSADLPVE